MAVFGLPGQHVSVETFGGLTDVRPSQDDNIRLVREYSYFPGREWAFIPDAKFIAMSNAAAALAMILRSRAQ